MSMPESMMPKIAPLPVIPRALRPSASTIDRLSTSFGETRPFVSNPKPDGIGRNWAPNSGMAGEAAIASAAAFAVDLNTRAGRLMTPSVS